MKKVYLLVVLLILCLSCAFAQQTAYRFEATLRSDSSLTFTIYEPANLRGFYQSGAIVINNHGSFSPAIFNAYPSRWMFWKQPTVRDSTRL